MREVLMPVVRGVLIPWDARLPNVSPTREDQSGSVRNVGDLADYGKWCDIKSFCQKSYAITT
jgi:hypothetical protein